MIIEDIIKDYPDDYALKIGAKDGNGYFYFGTVSDWRENQKEYSDILKANHIVRRDKARETCEEAIQEFCFDVAKHYHNGSISKVYMKSIEGAFSRISKLVNTKTNAERRVDIFIPLNERIVVEYWEADIAVDEDCLVILVKGTEAGKFWDGSEMEGTHIGLNRAAEDAMLGMGART